MAGLIGIDTADLFLPERDERPKKDGWCTGWYVNFRCSHCDKPFVGDKRAITCAPCAYNDEPPKE